MLSTENNFTAFDQRFASFHIRGGFLRNNPQTALNSRFDKYFLRKEELIIPVVYYENNVLEDIMVIPIETAVDILYSDRMKTELLLSKQVCVI